MRVGTDKSALFAAVQYYRCSPQRITRGSNGLRTVIRRPPVRLQKCGRLPGKLEAARRAAKRKPRRPICTPPASACVRARHPTRARICVRVVAFVTPGRREPDAARWTHRAGSHPGRDMCGMALRGACAPDIRHLAEITPGASTAASINKNQKKQNIQAPAPGPGAE